MTEGVSRLFIVILFQNQKSKTTCARREIVTQETNFVEYR